MLLKHLLHFEHKNNFRHVMSSDKTNPAFDVIKANIYTSQGRLLGLKIFPDK